MFKAIVIATLFVLGSSDIIASETNGGIIENATPVEIGSNTIIIGRGSSIIIGIRRPCVFEVTMDSVKVTFVEIVEIEFEDLKKIVVVSCNEDGEGRYHVYTYD